MDMNEEALKKHYQQLPDDDIERLANYEAKELSPEALSILKDEIKRHGLSDDFNVAVDIQVKGLTDEEQRSLIDQISRFPCPICGKKQSFLNASNVVTVKSFLIVTTVEKPLIIACPDCILSRAKRALIKSLFLGWWGIPWGPIRTIHSIYVNLKALNSERYHTPTQEFIEYIKPHSAAIKARINRTRDLNEFLDIIYQS